MVWRMMHPEPKGWLTGVMSGRAGEWGGRTAACLPLLIFAPRFRATIRRGGGRPLTSYCVSGLEIGVVWPACSSGSGCGAVGGAEEATTARLCSISYTSIHKLKLKRTEMCTRPFMVMRNIVHNVMFVRLWSQKSTHTKDLEIRSEWVSVSPRLGYDSGLGLHVILAAHLHPTHVPIPYLQVQRAARWVAAGAAWSGLEVCGRGPV